MERNSLPAALSQAATPERTCSYTAISPTAAVGGGRGQPFVRPMRLTHIGAATHDTEAVEAALRRHVEQLDIEHNRARLSPPLSLGEIVGFAVMLAVAALIGAMLAIGGVL